MHPEMLHELARAQIADSIAVARRHQLAQSVKSPRPEPPPRSPLPFGFARRARRRRLRLLKA
jgi:hypothetical protein